MPRQPQTASDGFMAALSFGDPATLPPVISACCGVDWRKLLRICAFGIWDFRPDAPHQPFHRLAWLRSQSTVQCGKSWRDSRNPSLLIRTS
jgi:hypothetical protein